MPEFGVDIVIKCARCGGNQLKASTTEGTSYYCFECGASYPKNLHDPVPIDVHLGGFHEIIMAPLKEARSPRFVYRTDVPTDVWRLQIPPSILRILRKNRLLDLCEPPERSTLVSLQDAVKLLGNKYDFLNQGFSRILHRSNTEQKIDKEVFYGMLFGFALELKHKRHAMLCIPERDAGTDVYLRLISHKLKHIWRMGVQICEYNFAREGHGAAAVEDEFVSFLVRVKLNKRSVPSRNLLLVVLEGDPPHPLDLHLVRHKIASLDPQPYDDIASITLFDEHRFLVATLKTSKEQHWHQAFDVFVKTREHPVTALQVKIKGYGKWWN